MFLTFLMIMLLFFLTGCFDWLGELIGDHENSTLMLKGSVENIKIITVDAQNPGFKLPNLSGDQQAIVAISPCEIGDYDLQITLDNVPIQGLKTQMLSNTSAEELLFERKMSDDYFTYDGQFEELTSAIPLSQIEPQSDQRSFWVSKSSGNEFYQVTANKVKSADVLTKIEIWVDRDLDDINSTQLNEIRAAFDKRIYEYLCNQYDFGQPKDIDNNGKTILLITSLASNLAGFFHEINFFDDKYSNQADMIYLNSDLLIQNQMTQICSNIAHEFQHLLFFSEKIMAKEKYPFGQRFNYNDLWINEGFSMLASELTGYLDLAEDSRIFDKYYGYFSSPNRDGLLTWEETRQLSNYGSAGLFAYYLYENYGNEIIENITRTGDKIEAEISQTSGQDFETIFSNWMTANMIDRFANIPLKYFRYSNISLKGVPKYKELTLIDQTRILGRGVQYYLLDEKSSNKYFNLAESSGYPLPKINVSIVTFH